MGLRPDIPCKKHKNGSIELYATIAKTKRGCAYFDTPSCVHRGGSTREVNTVCARACSLSKQSGERKANNNSAQGIALGICLYVSVAPLGQKNEKQLPLPTAFLYGFYSFALSGRYTCCILSPGRCPGLTYRCPFGV